MKLKASREFKIGFFGIAMIACLYWGINFLKGKDIFSTTKHYYAVYDQVNGLQGSASVTIRGFKVGSLSGMSYDPAQPDKVVVEFSIKSKYPIPRDTKARIFNDGIMGGKAIELQLGASTDYLQNGDTLRSEINRDLLDMAGSEFASLTQKADELIGKLSTTLDQVNLLLSNNQDNVSSSLSHISELTGNLNRATKNDLPQIMAHLNTLSATLSSKSGQIGKIVDNLDRFSDTLSHAPIASVVSDMGNTVALLNSTLAKINEGDGTAGMLINDKALYDSLVTASHNLSALLADIKSHPKRYINISVFGGRDRQ